MAKMLINGKSVDAQSGKVLDVLSPVDGQKFDEIPRGEQADVDLAVKAANLALTGAWGNLTALERGRLLMKLGEKVLAHHAELSLLEAKDTGKPMTTAKTDITVLARYFEFYGTGADKVHGQVLPFLDGYTVNVLREPLGVTGHIIPWNYPAQMMGRTIAPALAMGNAVVVKPAEDACLTPIRIAELARDVGFPEGAINVVTGLGEEAGAALAEHPGINFISFTGSNEVGIMVQKAAAKNVIKCVLELGGKSPHVVFSDADIDRAVPIITRGIIANTGQTCTAGSRLIIQKEIYPQMMDKLAKQFEKIKVGTPDMDLDCGPVVNVAQRNRVELFLNEAKKSGIEMVAQGTLAMGLPSDGYYVTPTLLGNVPPAHRCAQEEIFGPVLAAMAFDTEAEGIALANGTDYGLMAAIWTENGGRQQRVSKAIKAGQVYINAFGAGGGVELPFGGVKKSGHGREKGFLALEEMSTTKTVIHYHG
jgi:aldehyde dehydrogenase (NAD+)